MDDASLCDGNSPRVLLDGQGEAASEVQADPLADVPRPLQRGVDRIVIALSVIAAIVFAAFSFFPQVYVTGVETNNQVAVVSEWVLLLFILYFNLMLAVRTVRLALYVHMSNVNHKREACKVCYELRA